MHTVIESPAVSVARISHNNCRPKLTIVLLLPFIFAMCWPRSCFADAAPDFSGAELYQHFCASCHGTQAYGDGPVAKTLKVPVPDLTLIATRHGGTFPTEQIHAFVDGQTMPATHGSREMPVWGWEFYGRNWEAPEQRQRVDELLTRLIDYLRSIQR